MKLGCISPIQLQAITEEEYARDLFEEFLYEHSMAEILENISASFTVHFKN